VRIATAHPATLGRAASTGARRLLRAAAALVSVATGLVVLVIVIGIGFVVLKANPHNSVVHAIRDVGSWLTQPFHHMFTPRGHSQRIAVNWGLAAVVYLIGGNVIARLLRR
jgi:hypothetical protein